VSIEVLLELEKIKKAREREKREST